MYCIKKLKQTDIINKYANKQVKLQTSKVNNKKRKFNFITIERSEFLYECVE